MLSTFAFKQFRLVHGDGVWKVGTDSVLLGSWCRIDQVSHVVDMGTGSGILALMLAQRFPQIQIDAVEIVSAALDIARENFTHSQWQNRIRLLEMDLMKPDPCMFHHYEAVVCNPPYFPGGLVAQNALRQAARQGRGFTIRDVPKIACQLMKPGGRLHIVIPYQSLYPFIEQANAQGLYVHRKLSVRHHSTSPDALALLELSDRPVKAENTILVLYEGTMPTQDFVALSGGFISI